MRVLHVTRDFPPHENGGLSTAVGGMVRASQAAGIDCAVVSFDGYRPNKNRTSVTAEAVRDRVGGVELTRVSAPSQLDAAHELAVAPRPDIVHVHHSMLWSFARAVARDADAATVKTIHVLQSEQNRLRGLTASTMSSRAQATAIAEADRVIAPSRAVAERLARDHPAVKSRLFVVGLGIDDSEAARAAARDHAARAAKASGPVLYAGRFADINGIAELFAALPRIAEQVDGAKFVIAGGLPENRRAEARWRDGFLESAADDLVARVELTGWLSAAELSDRYRQAAVLVAPSWFETFGQVILEGMLYGLPIAATTGGAIPELVTHDESGLLSEPGDVDGLVERVVTLLTDRTLAARVGTAAAQEVRPGRLWPSVMVELQTVYRSLDGG